MRDLNTLNQYRRSDAHVMDNWGWAGDGNGGMFMVPSPIDKAMIAVLWRKHQSARIAPGQRRSHIITP